VPKNIYKLSDGRIVPGVTTIVNQLGKGDSLINWAWECGKAGKDWREERDTAGDIGTAVHDVAMMYLREETPTVTDEKVELCFNKFLNWWLDLKCAGVQERLVEMPKVSEKLAFGGQPDLVYELHGKWVLCDIKTSNGIYDSYWLQLAGYGILLKENGYRVDEYQILWLPKDDRFDAPIRTDLKKEKEIFTHLLKIYQLRH